MTTKSRLLLLLALTPLVMADMCAEPDCTKPPVEVLSIATSAVAANDPCAGKSERQIIAWYAQAGVKYPLSCGRTGRGDYGYLHITRDPADAGAVGHGDPINDASFSTEITATLARGAEGFVGGGTWRYTLEDSEGGKLCTNAWGFRVVPPSSRRAPLTAVTVRTLRVWLHERGGLRHDPLFSTRTGRRLSDDAVEARVGTTRPSPPNAVHHFVING